MLKRNNNTAVVREYVTDILECPLHKLEFEVSSYERFVSIFEWGILFIQETKIESIDDHIIRYVVPWSQFEFVICPFVGVLGGILLVWNAAFWQKLDFHVGQFSASVLPKDARSNVE